MFFLCLYVGFGQNKEEKQAQKQNVSKQLEPWETPGESHADSQQERHSGETRTRWWPSRKNKKWQVGKPDEIYKFSKVIGVSDSSLFKK